MPIRPSLLASLIAVSIAASCGHERSARTDAPSPPPPPATPSITKRPPGTRTVAADELSAARLASPVGPAHASFDRRRYIAEPEHYLAEVSSSRIYDVAAPAADVPLLAADGPTGFRVATGDQAVLAARGEPGMPVTFTSFGLGEFTASGLQSVTVGADRDGVARANLRITPGTVGTVRVIAGSPVRAGTISYLVQIPEGSP